MTGAWDRGTDEVRDYPESPRLLLVGTAGWFDPLRDALEGRMDASIRTVGTVDGALEAIRDRPTDGLIAERTLPDGTGIELLREVRADDETLPVILGVADGDERLAGEALAAGVSGYVAIDDPIGDAMGRLLDRTADALRAARRAATRRERARQFDTVFHDTQTATWVLDPDGSLARANRTARAMIGLDDGTGPDEPGGSDPGIDADEPGDTAGTEGIESIIGEPFWTLPWWSDSAATRADVRRLVEDAFDGRFGTAVVFAPADATDGRTIELSVRPVESDRGEVASIVVEGVDVSDQVELERDLRRSEELHRVTLDNMTDTVLMTDEDGEFTYVCPNVHFIFGYTAPEIRERGTIDELLGTGLFDREELADEGVLKNIECTVSDKAGREHTLLVNVREVSIQDGKLLYSCRDITTRKRREEALATLQETARDFPYAGTHEEIARRLLDDVPGVLDLDASAVYLFDVDSNELRPAARSSAMTTLHGPLPTVHADGDTLPGHSFIEEETLVFDDVHGDDRLANRATELRSMAYVPLGDHGVFVAGSEAVGAFDGVTRELADLLAATAEAALDRVSRESRLRSQDRELQHKNKRLTELNRINETIRAIDRAIVRAETRDEIDHTVCERLTDADRFRFAWIGGVDAAAGTIEPRAWAGDDRGYLDDRSFTVGDSGTEPAERTAATDDVTAVPTVATDLRGEPWRTDALTRDFLSVLSVPLVYNELSYGVLTVYADTRGAFEGTTRAVVAELGETIASAHSAVERKNALLSTSVTRLEFAIDDPTFVLSRLARDAECTLAYRGGLQRTSDGRYVFVTVRDAAVDDVVDAATESTAVDDVRRISTGRDGGVVRLELAGPFLAPELADHGVVFREETAEPETTSLAVDVPDGIDVRNVSQLVRRTFAGAELRSKRTLSGTDRRDLRSTVVDRLTDRQLEVVRTAYYSGFFESPRERTGEEIAETLGFSPAAFYRHVRTVQRKLFTALFEERDVPIAAPPERVE